VFRMDYKDDKTSMIEFGSTSSTGQTVTFWGKHRVALLYCCASVTLVAIIMLPITFLVIIPSIIVSETNRIGLFVESTTIINPSDTSFDITSYVRFSDNSPVDPTVVDLTASKIFWGEPGGGNILKLKDTNRLSISTSPQKMQARASVLNDTALTDFTLYSISAESFDWKLKSDAVVRVMGIDVPVTMSKKVTMDGYNDFDIDPIISNVSVYDGSATTLYSSALATLYSKSNLALVFGQDLYYNFVSEGETIGVGLIPNCSILMGEFVVESTLELSYSTTAQYDQLMSVLGSYLSGLNTNVSMKQFYLASPVAWLEPALASMDMDSVLPGLQISLITHMYLYVSPRNLINVPFTLLLYNALGVDLLITAMQECTVYYLGTAISTVELTGLSILDPAYTSITTPQLTSKTILAASSVLLDLLAKGYGLLDVYCTISALANDFSAKVKYFQLQVPANITQA
jgi:hypothetical protein